MYWEQLENMLHFYCGVFFLAVLKFELRALSLLGSAVPLEALLQPFILLVTYASPIAGIMGTCHLAQLIHLDCRGKGSVSLTFFFDLGWP
jgi:hypothetical protein